MILSSGQKCLRPVGLDENRFVFYLDETKSAGEPSCVKNVVVQETETGVTFQKCRVWSGGGYSSQRVEGCW